MTEKQERRKENRSNLPAARPPSDFLALGQARWGASDGSPDTDPADGASADAGTDLGAGGGWIAEWQLSSVYFWAGALV